MTDMTVTERCPCGFRCESCAVACDELEVVAIGCPWGNDVPDAVPEVSAERPSAADPAEHRPEARRAAQPASGGFWHPSFEAVS